MAHDLNDTNTVNTPSPTLPARGLLRAEGLACLLLACALYQHLALPWSEFALYFLVPDVSLLVYLLKRPVWGMWAYNSAHSTLGPALLGALAFLGGLSLCQQWSLIWFAHIGFDRALGYGLKTSEGFRFTHLGVIGKTRQSA